jgi:hypothetical protein
MKSTLSGWTLSILLGVPLLLLIPSMMMMIRLLGAPLSVLLIHLGRILRKVCYKDNDSFAKYVTPADINLMAGDRV